MANENPFEDPFSDPQEGSEQQDVQHFSRSNPAIAPQPGMFAPGTYQIPIPDATAVLVLGIISIVGSFCYGIVGLVLAIIGLALASRGERRYQENKERYLANSYSNLKAGRICSLIGLILSILMLIVYALYIAWAVSMVSNAGMYDYY
jgi:hypothetical protein